MDPTLILVLVFSVLSSTCECLLMYGFLKLKELNTHPGRFLFLQCIFQLVYHTHWLTAIPELHKGLGERGCIICGSIFAFILLGIFELNLFISIEVYFKLHNPINDSHQKRLKIYYSSMLVTLIFCVIILNFCEQDGNSGLRTCFVEEGSPCEVISVLPLIMTIVCIIMTWLCFRENRKNNLKIFAILKYNIYVVLSLCLTLLPSAIYDTFDWSVSKDFDYQQHAWISDVKFM